MRIPTDCGPLDAILGGGIESDTLTLLFGEGGSGKTNLCLQMARNLAREGKKVILIDTEGVSLERLAQIAGEDVERVLKNILFFEAHDLLEQHKMVKKAAAMALKEGSNIGLVILDSATVFYRIELSMENDVDERSMLSSQMILMLSLARKRKIPVILTTQVYTDRDAGIFKPIGGQMILHNAKTIIQLERVGIGRRSATVRKHRSVEEGQNMEFLITDKGIE